ncbi:MAG TPA: hypothetical protein VK846_13515, partial [Candidatus Limnocylindria bacterium]|nr:hypothetical protein [Candidatus Limnocylindria bacterium]
MNNTSGSALARLSFVLLLFIAGGVVYLVVRNRDYQDQLTATEPLVAAAPAPAEAQPIPASQDVVTKPTYAPLRPRAATNVSRSVANRLPATGVANGSSNPLLDMEANGLVVKDPVADPARPDFGALAGADAVTSKGVSLKGRAVLQGTPPPEKTI